MWGDEFEGHVIKIFDKEKKVLLQPNTTKVFKYLEDNRDKLCFIPLPEFGSWMLETTPTKPY